MPRDRDSSGDRSRSQRNKKYRKSSSESEHSVKRKHFKFEKKSREPPAKLEYDYNAKSDIKNHIRYDNVKIRHKSDQDEIIDEVRKILKKEFGPIEHITKLGGDDNYFSFAIGFKYDKDALQCIKDGGSIDSMVDRIKLVGKPTAIFQNAISLIKEAKKNYKRQKSPEARKTYKKYSSSEREDYRKQDYKKRRYSPKRQMQKQNEKSIWMFGLPWSIKGKQVQSYLSDHTSGPFSVSKWRWARVKNSNCEFMQVSLDEKKANKLLGLRQQQQIEGCPCIITSANSGQSQDIIKETLKQYQFKITFPQKINPASLYKALNDSARVVQIISCNRLSDGRSDSFIVTLASSSKAKDVKRLGYLSGGIKVQEVKGQLVFRPTKHSKLIEHDN